MINEYALKHEPKSNYCFAYDDETIEIRFKSMRKDLKNLELVYGDKYDWENTVKVRKMNKILFDKKYDYYSLKIEPKNKRLAYYFKLLDNNLKTYYYTEWGFIKFLDESDHEMVQKYIMHYPYLNSGDVHKVPNWVKNSIFYQIFPERFCNGNEDLNPEKIVSWDSKPTEYNYFGGDLDGIYKKLDHLYELGINAIYMTPIFKAYSNHKYDTIDYKKIDPSFGSLETLKKLVNKAHKLNIKVVLDCVFNHSGIRFDKFQDVIMRGKSSHYKDWFHINSFSPLEYDKFGMVPSMPKLNTENPEVINYLLDIATYWIKEANIDGWRLDVANEIDHNFWKIFRKEVKAIKSDAFIVGEIWHNSKPWLHGDQFDSIMNYPIQTACLEYFAKETIDLATFKYKVNRTYFDYSKQVSEVMMNLLDSHDTPRFITESKGNWKKLLMAFVFEAFYLGCTSIYYGTEVGMTGEMDPGCRKGMLWNKEKWNIKLFDLYKKIIKISNENNDILASGEFRWINKGKFLAFKRYNKSGELIIIINNNDNKIFFDLEKSEKYEDLINGKVLNKSISCDPNNFMILKKL